MHTRATALAFLLAVAVPAQGPGTSYRFRVVAGGLSEAQHALLEREFDLLHHDNMDGSHDVIVVPERLAAWKALQIPAVLVDRGRPYAEIAAQAAPAVAPDPSYYTPAEIVQVIDSLVTQYPTLAKRVDLSALPGAQKTIDGNSIWALEVSKNVAIDEDEPAVLIAAQHHARELNAAVMVVEAMKRVLAGYATDPALQALVDGHELFFVPCVNPDGTDWVWTTDNFWRKNRRPNGSNYGVDNNRNYPNFWSATCGGSTTTSSETFRGPSAGSEPETITMIAAVKALSPEVYLDFHSYGQEVLFPYGPCISPHASLTAFLNVYIDDLRSTIGYSTRASSASAEAPHQHWAERGTLSLLVEVGQAFQPTYASTLVEEARVWPGVKKVLTQWRPALAGHVRSIYKQTGIEAQITYTPSYLTQGEKVQSRARDGRFALWVPVGTYQVTFSAAGYQPVTRPVTVTALNTTTQLEIELVPVWTEPSLSKAGSDKIGTVTTFTYTSPGDAGDAYWIALSGSDTPGLPIGSRTVPLTPDGLFLACATPNTVLTNNLGVLPAAASAQAALPIPNSTAFIGIKIWAGGITLASGYPSYLKKFSPSLALTFQP